MQVCYVHGFNATHRTFNFVTHSLPAHEIVEINYDSHRPLEDSIAQVVKQLPKKPFTLVGHSLGGIISTLIALRHPERVEHLVVVSSPLGGSKAANTLKWIPGYPKILGDITPNSRSIQTIGTSASDVPTLSIISTGGNLVTSGEANDSVVTVSSQKALKFGRQVEVKANHFEVLMHEKTVKLLHDFLFGDTQ